MSRNSIDILAHRGFWKQKAEQNTETAFRKALEQGCGIETDFRDLNGEIVIAHDMARTGAMAAREFFKIYQEYKGAFPLAINIKADGLCLALKALLEEFGINNYFCFDMSVPDSLAYAKHDLCFYMRVSEIEPMPSLFPQAGGLWLDQFYDDWLTPEILHRYARQGKTLAIVSPELHKRPFEPVWTMYRAFAKQYPEARILLCTDHVDEARKFFA